MLVCKAKREQVIKWYVQDKKGSLRWWQLAVSALCHLFYSCCSVFLGLTLALVVEIIMLTSLTYCETK